MSSIVKKLGVKKYDVIKVIDNWFEFLQQNRVDKEIKYKFYRSDFADWLAASWS